jgi:hypothetical protein
MNRQELLELANELDEADFINPTNVCARAAAALRSLVAESSSTLISDHQSEINEAMRVLGIQ